MSAFDFSSLKNAFKGGGSESALDSLTLQGVATLLASGKVRNIVTMVGAGISTTAGIPDFRSPHTGLYDNLEEYNLPHPMAVFTLSYFEQNPKPFFEVARRLYSPHAKPTLSHYFIRLLSEKGLLRRHYTQNVDDLERLSGLPEEKFIEAHGTFHTGHCLSCREPHTFEYMKNEIVRKRVPKCSKKSCDGVVKPDIVFFGENLPARFYNNISSDFSACDLLIIMGTSLTVLPFAGLIHRVSSNTPRLYMNREYTDETSSGFISFIMRFMVAGFRKSNLRWGKADNKRDVFHQCNTDDGVLQLAELLGWADELLTMKESNDEILASKLAAQQRSDGTA